MPTLTTMTLDRLPIDEPAKVVAVDSRDPVMLRLMEMGLVPGASVTVRKIAPFGGPMELQVGATSSRSAALKRKS